ncbi:MAG: HEAT repeat domain-containing protein [Thermodesulfobacteriota bacterium]
MRPVRISLMVALIICSPAVSFAVSLGPYSGTVIDSQTGEPIEGASVLFYWEKRVPTPPSGGSAEPAETRLVHTDKKGLYDIPRILANLGLLAFLESTNVIIYQPGYQVYIARIWHDTPDAKRDSSFKPRGNLVKLDRIPPNFNYKEHYRMIEDALNSIREYGWEDRVWERKLTWEEHLKLNLKSGILEKEELLRRAEWEEYAGFSSGDPENLSEWMGLLRTGNEKERKLALIQLPGSLNYPAIQEKSIFDPILQALKDKIPSIRAAAAASLKLFGRSHPGDLEEKKRIALQRELVKKGDPHFKKTFPESLSYHEARNLIVPHLLRALGDKEPKVRQEAAKALAFYKNEETVDELIRRLHDKDPWVRLHAVSALGELRALKAIDPLLNLLEDDSDWRNKFVQQECVRVLRKIGSPTAIGLGGQVIRITPEIRTPDGRTIAQGTTRTQAPRPPARIGGFDDETTSKVMSVFIRKSDDPYLRALTIGAFGQFKALEAREVLLKAKDDPDERIRKLALDALLQISALQPREDSRIRTEPGKKYTEDMLDILRKSIKDPSLKVRADAVAALGKSGDERAVDLLIEALRDSDRTVKRNAIEGLGQFRDEKILDRMLPFFGSQESGELAAKTFMSVVEKTTREGAFVHRRDGIRHVSKNTFDIPRDAKISRRMVHPTAVGKLIETIGRSDEKGKLSALGLLPRFEDKRIEKVLLSLLEDSSPQLKARVVSLVPYFFDDTLVPALIAASKDQDAGVRVAAVRALGEFDERRRLEPLIERLGDNHWEVRNAALHSLKGHDDPRLSDIVIRLLTDESASVRRAAVSNIKERKDGRAVEALMDRLNDEDFLVPSWSADALGVIGDRKAVPFLMKAAKGELDKGRTLGGDADLRRSAVKSLGLIGDKEAVSVLISVFEVKELRNEAIVALGSIKDPGAVSALLKCLSDDDPNVRRLAASALRKIGDPVGLEAVKDIPEDKPPPPVSSSTPTPPKALKPLPPAIRKDFIPVPGSGLSVTMFGREEKKEERPPGAKEEKPAEIPVSPPTRMVSKYDPKPRPLADMKPLLRKLKANDPKIKREATDSLGDTDNPEATDLLLPLLKDKDEYVRQAAARALGKLKDKKAVEPLIVSLKDPDPHVRTFSVWALGEIQDIRAIEPLCTSLFDKETKVKDQSFEALRRFREPVSRTAMVNTLVKNAKVQPSAEPMLSKLISFEGREVVLKALEDLSGDHARTVRNYIHLMEANIYYNISDIATQALEDYPDRGTVISELSDYIGTQPGVPSRSISLLSRFKDPRVLPIYLDLLKNRNDPYYRLNVVNAMGELGDKDAKETFFQVLIDHKEYPGPRNAAAMALGKIGAQEAVDPLITVLRNRNDEKHVRVGAAVGLGMLKNRMAVEPLIDILNDTEEDTQLRVSAASSLGDIGDERAIIHLEAALKDPPDFLRHAVEIALRKLKAGK